MPLAQILRRMRKKFTELTYTEWDIVQPNARGRFVPTTIDDNLTDASNLYFQTCAKISNPKRAYESAREFFGASPSSSSYIGKLDRSCKVVIPARWMRQTHLEPVAI